MAGEHTRLLCYVLLAVSFIVIELVQIGIVVKVAGLLDHVFPVLLRRMDAGGEVELVQIFRQASDLRRGLRTS